MNQTPASEVGGESVKPPRPGFNLNARGRIQLPLYGQCILCFTGKRYGFATYAHSASAQAAVNKLNGAVIDENHLKVGAERKFTVIWQSWMRSLKIQVMHFTVKKVFPYQSEKKTKTNIPRVC